MVASRGRLQKTCVVDGSSRALLAWANAETTDAEGWRVAARSEGFLGCAARLMAIGGWACLCLLAGCGGREEGDALRSFAYLRDGEVWVGNTAGAVERLLGPEPAGFDRVQWTGDGRFLVASRRWSILKVGGEGESVELSSSFCLGSSGFVDPRVHGELLFYRERGIEQQGANGDPVDCSYVVRIPSGDFIGEGGASVTSDGRSLALVCRERLGQTRGTLRDLEHREEVWEREFPSCPRLSPGGSRVAFVDAEQLWVQSADLSAAPRLLSSDAESWSWGPAGRRILIRGEGLQVFDFDEDRLHVLGGLSGDAQWTVAGTAFRIEEPCDDGTRFRVLDASGPPEELWSSECGTWGEAVLSPDGLSVLTSQAEELVLLDASGSTPVDRGHSPRWRPREGT